MKTLKFTLSVLLAFVLLFNKVNAQEKSSGTPMIDKLSISANFGSLLAYGDIKNYNFYPLKEERKWGFGAVVNYQISPILSFQVQGITGKLAGVKRNFITGKPANLKFDAEVYEGSINATVSLNRWWAPNLKINEKLNFYAMAGIGIIDFRTQLRGLKDDKFIKSYGWSSKGTVKEKMTTETTFPVGLGIKYKAAKKIDIILETQMRNVYSDKLDAYVRVNNSQDKYGYTFVGISYRFGKQEKHMEWIPNETEGAGDKLALDAANKKIDDLNKKLTDLETKVAEVAGSKTSDDPRFNELNKKIDDLAVRVTNLENKPQIALDPNSVDGGALNHLNSQIELLKNKNNDLDKRIEDLMNRPTSLTPTVVTSGGGVPILISVFFEVNKSSIDKDNEVRVAAAAKYMKDNPGVSIMLIGHADKTGGQTFNELLSERRAKAVQQALINDYGIPASRLSIAYKGFSEPLSQQNYSVNRRVDFIVK